MTSRKSGLRIALLASTALTAFALLSSPDAALAACPSGAPVVIGDGGSSGTINATGANSALNVSGGPGTALITGNVTSENHCAVFVDSNGMTINAGTFDILAGTVSGTDPAILVAGNNNTLNFTGTTVVGGGTTAMNMTGTSTAMTLAGSTFVNGDILYGGGTSTLTWHYATATVNGTINGGAGVDGTLNLVGAGSGNVNLDNIVGFEFLNKLDAGTANLMGTGVFTGVNILGGTLSIAAGGSVTVNAGTNLTGALLDIRETGSYTATVGINGGAGVESIVVAGTLNTGTGAFLMGGNDNFVLENNTGFPNPSVTGIVDAGAGDSDNLILDGDDNDTPANLDLTTLGDANQYRGFENLIKNGAGTWDLVNANGNTAATGAFQTLTVNEGILRINPGATLNVIGGTTNVNGGTLLVAGVMNESGDTTVGTGGMIVVSNGTFNAGDAVGTDTTTINDGTIRIEGGGFYVAGDGPEDTTTLTHADSLLAVVGGTYTANGSVIVQDGQIEVISVGTFNANDTTTVSGNGGIDVDSAIYNAGIDIFDTTNIQDSGSIQVNNGGTYNANAQTNMSGASQLRVFGSGLYDATGFNIVVNSGTVLGSGTIITSNLLNIAGTVSPGGGLNDPGTLSVTGLYTQQAGGNFQADLQPGGPPDLLDVTGSAALLGNVQLNTLSSSFGAFEQHRIVATDNPIPTIFDTASVSGAGLGSSFAWVGRVDDAGDFDPDDPASGNNVDVIIATSPAALSGLTPNQQAVADYLGSYAMPGGVYIEDSAILLITEIAAAGPNALDQIGGEVYDSFTTFAFDTGRQYGRMVDDRVRMLRCAAQSGIGGSGAASPLCATETPTLLADTGPDSIPTPGADSPRGFSPNTHPYGWSIWASAIGSFLSKDRTSTNLGYSGSTYGGVMGVDLAITKRWIVGVMVGGSFSNIDFSGVGGDGDLSNMGVGVYTAWLGSRWFASASFTYSKNWIEADRTLQFGTVDTTANGKTEGDQLAAHATLGYGFLLGKVALEVAGGIDWVQLRQDAFTETGAGLLNLSVRSRTDDSLRLRIGVRAAVPFQVRTGLMLTPSAKVGYAREVLDNTRPITSSLSPIPGTFTVHGDDGSRNIVTFGAGVKADWSQGVTVSLDYNGEWAGDRQIHGITGRIQIRW